jgi:anaerobic selenocysteine-containing dehydrogenase
MRLSRRSFIKAGAAATAAATPVLAFATPGPVLVIFDGRNTESRAFARAFAAPAIDIAQEDANFWRQFRAVAPEGHVVGLTGWSDWVLARGFLEEKGKRLREEVPTGQLFRWTMA